MEMESIHFFKFRSFMSMLLFKSRLSWSDLEEVRNGWGADLGSITIAIMNNYTFFFNHSSNRNHNRVL